MELHYTPSDYIFGLKSQSNVRLDIHLFHVLPTPIATGGFNMLYQEMFL